MRLRLVMALLLGLLTLPAADAFAQASQAPAGGVNVQTIANLVRQNGRDSTLAAQWLPPLGIGPESLGPIPSRNHSYKIDEDQGAVYAFSLIQLEGREIMLVARFVPQEMIAWRIDGAGTPVVTIQRAADDQMRTVASASRAAQLKQVLARLTRIAATGS